MKTAVDSSVLLDVFGADSKFGARSREALRRAYDEGALVACDVIWAEVRASFLSDESFEEAVVVLGLAFDPIGAEAASLAGRLWQESRRRGGRRGRIVADFLVGAHAQQQADRLFSRDRGFYRSYFSDLTLLDPAA